MRHSPSKRTLLAASESLKMEFFKVKAFRRSRKSKKGDDPDPETGRSADEGKKDQILEGNGGAGGAQEEEDDDDDDDDFITNEVKRRLKELRKNSFMVLIPEESPCPEDEETSSSEWREGEGDGGGYSMCRFEAMYDEYCKRMLFFDKMSAQNLKEARSWNTSSQTPRSSSSRKLASTLKSLSFKRRDEHQDDCEQLQQPQEDDPYQNLEVAYVAQICLTWEALHCQYTELSQKIQSQPEDPTSYCYAAQAFQQFQVLLQRFIENEPFEEGSRMEIYSSARSTLPKLLYAPSFQGLNEKDEGDYLVSPILAADLLNIMEESILTFHRFIKVDKKRSVGALKVLRGQNQTETPLQHIQGSLNKKKIKVKELLKKKGWKSKSWPATLEGVELLFGLIDIKVVSRALRMARISKEQLLWCDEKISKLDLVENKLRRDGFLLLFPC